MYLHNTVQYNTGGYWDSGCSDFFFLKIPNMVERRALNAFNGTLGRAWWVFCPSALHVQSSPGSGTVIIVLIIERRPEYPFTTTRQTQELWPKLKLPSPVF
jgi:hypothetical protein